MLRRFHHIQPRFFIAFWLFLALSTLSIASYFLNYETRAYAAAEKSAPVFGKTLDSSARAKFGETYGQLPLSFEANQGQARPDVDFVSRGAGYSLFLSKSGATLTLPASQRNQTDNGVRAASATIQMDIFNANRAARAQGLEKLPGTTNHFIGNNPVNWRTGVPTFTRVEYADIYPGIDVVYYGNNRLLEYDFVIAPHADPNNIQLRFLGTNGLRVDAEGNLLMSIGQGEVKQLRPFVYQELNGAKREVSSRYVIDQQRRVSFAVGSYDRTKPLVIDPVLVYASYLGGTFEDRIHDIAVDSAGNAYVTGTTYATNFPITPGAFQTSTIGIGNDLGGGSFAQSDAFITKFNSAGNAVIYSTYLGGTDLSDTSFFFLAPTRGNDVARSIAVDAAGNAYLTGITTSTNDFPVTPGAFQTAIAANPTSSEDVFVTKLNAAGNGLIYSTRLGGTDSDQGFAMAIDASGNAYLTGRTESTNFPTTPGAYLTSGSGLFITKLNSTGTGLIYSTLIGNAFGNGIAIDAQGNAFVTGQSLASTYPTTLGAFQTIAPGDNTLGFLNCFVTKLNAAGDGLVYSTFLAGNFNDHGSNIVLDTDGNAYVSGATDSNNFPKTPGAFKTTGTGGFLSKLNPSGSALVYSTIIGPNVADLALTPTLEVYMVGSTGNILTPTPDAFQSGYGGGGSDAYVMRLNATGSALTYASYLGGDNQEAGDCITVDAAGSAYVGGTTLSTNFPVSVGAFQITPTGNNFDVGSFVAKFSEAAASTFRISGRLTDGNGNGLAGVPVSLSGAMTGIQWTVADGQFSFGNLPSGNSYTVTPLNQRFNFTVASQTFDNLSSNQIADFVGTARKLFFFAATNYRANESVIQVPITVNRAGDASSAASVDYSTTDATASERTDYAIAQGTLRFAAGETSKTFDVFLTDDNFEEVHETLNVTLSNPTGGVELGQPDTAKITIISNDGGSPVNPSDSASFFVRQHYIDFLNRLPDQAGLSFWTGQITSCGSDVQCREIRRINVSAAFYLSIEFQETGYLVYRMYKASYGNLPSAPVPLRLREFMPDTREIAQGVIVGVGDWQVRLESNKIAFVQDFVMRSRFTTAFPTTLTPEQFVDALFANAGVVPSDADRNAAVGEFAGAGNTTDTAARARALRRVAENATLGQQETNRAFVLMQYFGYLRRNPNDAPEPGLNFDGYNFWLGKLNQFNGNFVEAEMVKAFITSGEYRQRFGP